MDSILPKKTQDIVVSFKSFQIYYNQHVIISCKQKKGINPSSGKSDQNNTPQAF